MAVEWARAPVARLVVAMSEVTVVASAAVRVAAQMGAARVAALMVVCTPTVRPPR